MPNIVLLRHTKPDVAKGICYGRSDVPLASSFAEEAQVAKEKLSALLEGKPTRYYSSPLQRCSRLAEILYGSGGIHFDERFQEMNFGAWEMKPWGEIDEFVMNAWMRDFVRTSPPEGETFEAVAQRSYSALQDTIQTLPEGAQNLVIVAHSGVIRAILATILELPLHKAFSLEIDYGSLSAIRYTPQYSSVLFINR